MPDEVYTYVGFNAQGEARAFVRDDPKFADDTAETVQRWIKEGRTVQRMTWAEMHTAMTQTAL